MLADWYALNSGYAEGAPTSTSGKPLHEGLVDIADPQFGGQVRRQNRWLNVNTPDIPSVIRASTARTIGVGITTQVLSPDDAFNTAAEQLIEEFAEIDAGELTGKHTFNSAMRAVSDFDLLDGGIIIRHHYNTAWAFPYKYELVGVDMIDLSKSSVLPDPDGGFTTAGLKRDIWGRVVGVWLYTDPMRRRSELVDMSNITYYSDVWVTIGQQVAVSKLASLLPTLDRIDQYAKAELESAIESAKAGAYLQSTAYNEIMTLAFEEISKIQNFKGKTDEIKTILNTLSRLGVKPQGLTPIPSGDNVLFPSQSRNGVYKELNDTGETKIASSQGMSSVSMYGKAEGANYSAIKYAAETDQLTANIRFDDISSKILTPINKRVIQTGVQMGLIPNRVAYWKKPARYNRFGYLRNINVDIEPAKTAAANQINLALGITTQQEIIEKKGMKYEDFLTKKIKNEIFEIQLRNKLFAEAGLPIPQTTEAPQ